MNISERRKRAALKPHRTKCCGTCRYLNVGWDGFGWDGFSCEKNPQIDIDRWFVCSRHKYTKKEKE